MPKDVVQQAGRTQWRWKLAETLTDARRCLPQAIAETDQLIADYRAGKTPTARPSTQQPRHLAKDLLAGKPPAEVFTSDLFHGTPEEAEEISQLPPVQLAGSSVFTAADVLALNERLKTSTSPQTIKGWKSAMDEFTQFLGHSNLHLLTKEDCQRYRDRLLDINKVSTVKLKMSRVAGLLELAVEEGHLQLNPARGLTKRLEEPKLKTEKLFDPNSDILINNLSQHHQDVYWLIRWTGMRAAEAAGLELENINLDEQYIRLVYLPDRPLKTKYSVRDVPIHPNILPLCQRLVDAKVRPFTMFYKPSRDRWEVGSNWRKSINCNPHLLRHHATTCMRNAGFQEFVIGRALGHEVPGMTAQYGSVSQDKIREAIQSIN